MTTPDHETTKLPLKKCLVTAVVGRTGAGKSTLINALLGEHLCIVSNKTQTTRQLIRGILRFRDCQMVLTDTPGFQESPRNQLNKMMNRHLSEALHQPDAVVWVADVRSLMNQSATEKRLMEKLLSPYWERMAESPALPSQPTINTLPIPKVVVVINKVDLIEKKGDLLPLLARLAAQYPHTEWVPLSALREKNTAPLLECLYAYATEREPLFPDDQYTTESERFLASELLREQLYKHLRQELPFGCAVVVDEFIDDVNARGQPVSRITMTIMVSSPNFKPMILGKKGEMLKTIASEARLAMEKMLDRRIFLTTWVKVVEDWQDDPAKLKTLGYGQ